MVAARSVRCFAKIVLRFSLDRVLRCESLLAIAETCSLACSLTVISQP